MSILTSRIKKVEEMPINGVYVIYGNNGTGKTVLASTFPKTAEKPMLYIDILEGGTRSISKAESENIQVVEIETFEDLDLILTDVLNGYTLDDTGAQVPIQYSTIVFDSATQLEFLMKQSLMSAEKKDKMNLNLWGQAKQSHDQLWNMAMLVNKKTHANIVIICHQKEVSDEENPGNNKIIPSLMNSAAYGLCAKASFVWYTKIETEMAQGEDGKLVQVNKFITFIDGCQAYLTKTRKPMDMAIKSPIQNLTYAKFKKNVLDKM